MAEGSKQGLVHQQQPQQQQTGNGFSAFGKTQSQQSTSFGTTQPQPRPQQPAGGLFDTGNSVLGLVRQAHVMIRSFVNRKNWDWALPSKSASGKFATG